MKDIEENSSKFEPEDDWGNFDLSNKFDESTEDESEGDDDERIPRKRKMVAAKNGLRTIEKKYKNQLDEDEDEPDSKKTKRLLPIKAGGKIIHRIGVVEKPLHDPKKAPLKTEEPEDERSPEEDIDEFDSREANRDLSQPVSTAELLGWREKALAKCRYKIGYLSSNVLEDPEQNISKLAQLNEMLNEYRAELSVTIKKLVSVSLTEIFKDILPSYQIKHQEDHTKLKKETLKLHSFEKFLLKQFRLFLEKLEKLAAVLVKKKGDTRVHSEQVIGLGILAINCLCDLLITHPYFNYSTNIAQMLVPYANNPRPIVRSKVASCISQVFKEDRRGEITLYIVRQINQLVKSKTNAVHCEVVSVFLALRLKDINLDQEKEAELNDKKLQAKRNKLLSLSRKEKKAKKRMKRLEQELLETKAEENKQDKHKTLTEVTKVVFTVYFRILKKTPSSKLLCTTLEGIAKFAPLINLEFYQDLVYVLNRLMDSGELNIHQQLLCILTVFTMLSGHGEALNIDTNKFYTHLYRNILLVHAGKTYAETELIMKSMDIVLLKRRKRITQQRLLAYTKRLTTLSLQLLHNGSLGCLGLVRNAMQLNKITDILLELDTSVGQGIYLPELEDPEHSNASSTALFELAALRRHYHPTVRKMAEHIAKNVPTSGDGSLPSDISKLSSFELFEEFNPSEMAFRPTIPSPVFKKYKYNAHLWKDSKLELLTSDILSKDLNMKNFNVHKEVRNKKSELCSLTKECEEE